MPYSLKGMDFKSHSFSFPGKTVDLHSMLIGVGYQRVESRCYSWDGLKRGASAFAVWQYTVSGQGRLEYEGAIHDIRPGFAMLVHIPHRHRYFFENGGGKPWDFLYACLKGSELLRLCSDIETRIGPVLDHRLEHRTVASVGRIVAGEAGRSRMRTPQEASLAAYRIAMCLVDDMAPRIEEVERKPGFIRRISDFCMANLAAETQVAEMASMAGYSRYHFSRLFRKHSGMNPAAFLREMRLKKAIAILQTERLEVKEVADCCGFASSSYFCRAFKKRFGISPDAYRKSGTDLQR